MTKLLNIERSLQRLERMAQDGEILPNAPMPLACIFDATRNAQILLGSGYLPLAALLDPVPALHLKNYLKERNERGWVFSDVYRQSNLES